MIRHMCFLATALIGICAASELEAQRPHPSPLFSVTTSDRESVSTRLISHRSLRISALRPDYRWEGAAIGGVLGGLSLGVLAARACSDACGGPVTLAAAMSVAVGGFTGLLIGGMFPKEEPEAAAAP